jgi:hypothetical protein
MCKKHGASERRKKAQKAKETAARLFPDEKWIKVENGIYLSSRRAIGKKTNYAEELRDARILRDIGSTVYLVPENRRTSDKKYDAIVDGLKMEFKNQHGASTYSLMDHFLDSREQAPNVFLNLEKSPLSHKKIIKILYRARNSKNYLRKSKDCIGGIIILKVKEFDRLIFLNVDDLKKT